MYSREQMVSMGVESGIRHIRSNCDSQNRLLDKLVLILHNIVYRKCLDNGPSGTAIFVFEDKFYSYNCIFRSEYRRFRFSVVSFWDWYSGFLIAPVSPNIRETFRNYCLAVDSSQMSSQSYQELIFYDFKKI